MNRLILAAVLIFSVAVAYTLISSQTQICQKTDHAFELGYLSTKIISHDINPEVENDIREDLENRHPTISFVNKDYVRDRGEDDVAYFKGNLSSSKAKNIFEENAESAETLQVYKSWKPYAVNVLEARYNYVNKTKGIDYTIKTDNARFERSFLGFKNIGEVSAEEKINLLSMNNIYLEADGEYVQLPEMSSIAINSEEESSRVVVDYSNYYDQEVIDRMKEKIVNNNTIKVRSGRDVVLDTLKSSDMEDDKFSISGISKERSYYIGAAIENPLDTEVSYKSKNCG